MGGRIQKLLVKIGGDSKGLQRASRAGVTALKGLERAGRRFADRIRSTGRAVRNLALAVAGLAFAGTKIFEIGSAVGETRSKFLTVFGEASGAMDKFRSDFARTAGLTRTEAEEILATSGAIVQGFGATRTESSELSRRIVALAGDLASFNNLQGGTAEGSEAIIAGLAGENEKLKRMGIVLRAVDVQRRAMLNTGKESVSQLTDLEKAYAALELIQEKAGVANGDLARTADQAANRGRRLRSVLMDLRDAAAVALLPALAELVEEILGGEEALDQLAVKMAGSGEQILAWGRVSVSAAKVVGQTLWGIARIAFEVGQIIGRIFDVAAMSIVWAFAKAVDKVAEWLNKIPGVELPTDNAEAVMDRLRVQTQGLGADFETIKTTVAGIVAEAQNLGELAGAASLVLNTAGTGGGGAPGGGAGGGGGGSDGVSEISDRLQRIAQEAFDETRTKAEQLEIRIRELTEAFVAGALDGETYARAIELAKERFKETVPVVKTLRDVGKDFAVDFATRIADAAASGTQSFREFAASVIAELKRIAIKFAIFKGLSAIFGGGGIVGSIGTAFGFVSGGRAHGGPVFPGRAYNVGELGRERIVAPTAGRVQRHDEIQTSSAPAAPMGDLHLSLQLVTSDGRVVVDGITHQQKLDKFTKRSERVTVPAAVIPTSRS